VARLGALIGYTTVAADGAVMQIVTRCDSVDEFIDRFAAFTTETYIVVPALPQASEGLSGQFVISLRDGSVMMKGRCEVTEVRSALMRLRLREMDAHSAGIHLRLMEWHAFSSAPAAALAAEAAASPPAETATTPPPQPKPPSQNESEAVPARLVTAESSAVTVVGETRPPSDNEITAVSSAPQTSEPADAAPASAETFGGAAQADRDPSPSPPAAPAARSGDRPGRAQRIGRRVGPYAVGMLVGLLVGIAIRPGWKAAPVAVAPPLVSPPVGAPAPKAAPLPVAAPPPEATPPPAAEPPPTVASTPDDEPMPPTSRLGSQHPKGLAAKVIVTSTPPRAFIKVNRHRLGRTPREISAPRYERVRIEASLPGYKRWKKTLTFEEAEVNLEVKLVRVREMAARQSSLPSGPPTRATPPSSGGPAGALAAR
jgi:hypothetical protein